MTSAPTFLNMAKFTLIPARVSYWFACSCAAILALALVIGGSTLVGWSSRLDLGVLCGSSLVRWSSRLDLGVLGGSKLGSLYSESGLSGVWIISGVTGV